METAPEQTPEDFAYEAPPASVGQPGTPTPRETTEFYDELSRLADEEPPEPSAAGDMPGIFGRRNTDIGPLDDDDGRRHVLRETTTAERERMGAVFRPANRAQDKKHTPGTPADLDELDPFTCADT